MYPTWLRQDRRGLEALHLTSAAGSTNVPVRHDMEWLPKGGCHGLLDPGELKLLLPAETSAFPSPIPTQSVSSDEFMPAPQLRSSASSEIPRQGVWRHPGTPTGHEPARLFSRLRRGWRRLRSMNDTYGRLYTGAALKQVRRSMANERAKELADQFIMDMHTHFLAR